MASLVQQAATILQRNPDALRTLVTPAVRQSFRDALSAESVAASRMTDTEFWSYDAAWLGLGPAPQKRDTRRPGGCGGGGCNMSWDNNQFWELGLPCDRGVFSLVMFQQRRYMAAQLRIARHLAAAPQPEVVAGFDRMAADPTLNLRAACGGQAPRDAAQEWAYWCEEALRLIGVARWSSNTSWSEGTRSIADMAPPTARPLPLSGAESGCTYRPDCSSDPFGVPRLGYVGAMSPRGMRRFEALVGRRYEGSFGERDSYLVEGYNYAGTGPVAGRFALTGEPGPQLDAARAWQQPSAPLPGERPVWSVAPAVLGLHQSSLSVAALEQRVPRDAGAFAAKLWPGAFFPSFLRPAGDDQLGSWLYAFFLESPADPAVHAAQMAARELSGCWWWSRPGRSGAYPTPAAELHIWRIVAMLRDIVDRSYGEVMVDSFMALDRTIESLPAWAKTRPLSEAQAGLKALFQAGQGRTSEMVGGALSAVAAVAAAINPIAGLIVGLLGALAVAMTNFAADIGLVRTQNPIAVQSLAMRVVPPVVGGEDRCWINPGNETLDAYRARVASPYAEAAQRTGGNAGAMFDEVATVRAERAGLIPPGGPQSSSAKPWGIAAIGGTAGFLAIRLLLGV
jgi:hypothetical protein